MLHLLAMDGEKPRRSAQERALLTGGRAIAEQGAVGGAARGGGHGAQPGRAFEQLPMSFSSHYVSVL